MEKPPETVTASEIADFVFCPETWRLNAVGAPSANRPERDAGTIHHAQKVAAEVTAGRSIAIGRVLIVVALLALAILWGDLTMTPWIACILLFAIGLAMVLRGRGVRSRRGLSQGRTLDLDGRNLYSARYGLTGRPDRVFDDGGIPIPEEWKSARRVHDSHRAQMGVYFILLEEETGIQPLYGVIVTGDGKREIVRNTEELRALVLRIAEEIRAKRRHLAEIIQVSQPAAKCRGCGVRKSCGQGAG